MPMRITDRSATLVDYICQL